MVLISPTKGVSAGNTWVRGAGNDNSWDSDGGWSETVFTANTDAEKNANKLFYLIFQITICILP